MTLSRISPNGKEQAGMYALLSIFTHIDEAGMHFIVATIYY